MSDDAPQTTKLTLRGDMAIAIASSMHGANLDVVGFNLSFIAKRDLPLARKILALYEQARVLQGDGPDEPTLGADDIVL